jgi:hypothetical protein
MAGSTTESRVRDERRRRVGTSDMGRELDEA